MVRSQRVGWVVASACVFVVHTAIQVSVSMGLALLFIVAFRLFPASLVMLGLGTAVDETMMLLLVVDVVCLAVAWPWWRAVRPRPSVPSRGGRPPVPPSGLRFASGEGGGAADPGPSALCAAPVAATGGEERLPAPFERRRITAPQALAVLATAVAVQYFFSAVLTLGLPLMPGLAAEYEALMEPMSAFDLVTVLSVTMIGPLVEELLYRGVALEFARRAFPGRFWAANVLQALVFAVAHLNVVQGAYAFVGGLVLGATHRRWGRLGVCVAAHFALNFSSYFVYLPDGTAGVALVGAFALAALVALVHATLVRPLQEEGAR